MRKFPVFKEFGEFAGRITWERKIDPTVNQNVLLADTFIKQRFKEVVLETVPAYNELAVYLQKKITPSLFITILKETLQEKAFKNPVIRRKVTIIPVCYDAVFALDLDRVAETNGLSKNSVIELHSAPIYKIYFLGFLPGFPYLGGLNDALHTSRLDTPRKKVDRGTVAIGGSQTGIYTSDTPGGWNIIGKTPLQLFDMDTREFFLLKAGDYIKFKPISAKEFKHISLQIESNTYTIKQEGYHDD